MATFAEHGTPEDGRCLWCGRKLRPFQPPEIPEPGYLGHGRFCTLSCGYKFGRWFADAGRRLRSPKRLGDPREGG